MTLRSVFSLVFAVALSVVALPAESSAQTTTWTFCAPEGGTCVVSGTRQVRFGGNGLFASKTVTGSVACTNAVFGDPAPGVPKRCESGTTSTSTPPPTSSWSVCANEGGTCAFSGTQQVRYGASSLFAYKTLTGGTACTNAVFGDPAPGVAKQCAVGGTSSAPPPPPPPATSAYGPQASITCPAGAVSIMPGQSVQSSVNVYPGTTTFCLRAGVHIRNQLGHTQDGQYVRRRVRGHPRRLELVDYRHHAGGLPRTQPGHRLRDDSKSRHPQDAPEGHPCLLLVDAGPLDH